MPEACRISQKRSRERLGAAESAIEFPEAAVGDWAAGDGAGLPASDSAFSSARRHSGSTGGFCRQRRMPQRVAVLVEIPNRLLALGAVAEVVGHHVDDLRRQF